MKFIEPIINENVDLPFGEYMRLALHDAGTFNVVGKKNGANGSIRFELDRPENADCKEAFASIERIKKKIDAVVTQPISWADVIAIVPHYAARIQFAKDYYEVMGPRRPQLRVPVRGHQPVPRRQGAHRPPRRRRRGPRRPRARRGRHPGGPGAVVQAHGPRPQPALHVRAVPVQGGDEAKGVDLAAQDGTNRAVLDQYASQRKLGRARPALR